MRIGCQNSRRTEDCFWEEDFEGKTKRKRTNLLLSRVHILVLLHQLWAGVYYLLTSILLLTEIFLS